MEKTIENAIDNSLESISSGLYLFSIGLGFVFIILGMIIFFTNKAAQGKKSMANGGIICFAIGVIAIVSGMIQM